MSQTTTSSDVKNNIGPPGSSFSLPTAPTKCGGWNTAVLVLVGLSHTPVSAVAWDGLSLPASCALPAKHVTSTMARHKVREAITGGMQDMR